MLPQTTRTLDISELAIDTSKRGMQSESVEVSAIKSVKNGGTNHRNTQMAQETTMATSSVMD